MSSDDDRIAYLAGEAAAPLDGDDQADLDGLRDLLADPSLWVEPDPSLEDRIVDAIRTEAAAGPAHARHGGTGTTAMAPRRPTLRRSGRRVRYAIAGAAAAAVAAVVVSVSLVAGGAGPAPFAADLAATTLAPGASGSATLTRTTSGWRVELRTSGLPRLDNGRFYEAWLVDDSGRLVAIGTFNQGRTVTLWSGVSPSAFPRISVTAQTVGGGQLSSGQRVLAGEIRPHR